MSDLTFLNKTNIAFDVELASFRVNNTDKFNVICDCDCDCTIQCIIGDCNCVC